MQTMRGLSICIDIDGTVTEPHYWLRRANEHFGKEARPEEVACYEAHQALGIPEDDYAAFYDAYGEQLHAEAEIREGVQQVLNELFRSHSLHFVTARDERMRDVSLEWLEKHGVPLDSISLLGHPNKVQKARDLQSDLFLEDSLDNAMQLASAGFRVLLVDCSYNQANLPPNVTRVKDWHEIGRIINQHAYQQSQTKAAN